MPVAVDVKDVRARVMSKLAEIEIQVDKKNFREATRLVESFFESKDYHALHNATIKTAEYSQPIFAHEILDFELLAAVRGELYFSSKYLIGLLLKAKF